jgi:hypothetical protein
MSDYHVPQEAWKTWQSFNRAIAGKDVIFFGVSSDWAKKTYVKSKARPICFIDNSPNWIGKTFDNIKVFDPTIIQEENKNYYIVITSASYESICPQLEDLGMKPGHDYCITPALNNLRVITDIHNHDVTLLLSSPDHKIYSHLDKEKDIGGGLYTYNTLKQKCTKVLDGTFHQIISTENGFYIADENRGICHVSKEFQLIETFGWEEGAKSHGIAYCPRRNLVFIAHTAKDKISAYDAKTKELCFDIRLSNKANETQPSHHWMNDICVSGDYLYVSLFSISGSQHIGLYDGGILQINLNNTNERYVLIQGLWMPHTVRFFHSEICFLDSMNGNFYVTDKNIIGEFFGFIRGLAFDDTYYYIGQSEARYFDRLEGIKKNIGMTAGFYLFDEQTKAAKFFVVPQVRQIHDLCVIRSR